MSRQPVAWRGFPLAHEPTHAVLIKGRTGFTFVYILLGMAGLLLQNGGKKWVKIKISRVKYQGPRTSACVVFTCVYW